MGPSLAVRAKRAVREAGHDLRVIADSRFSDSAARRWLDEREVETLSADLLDRNALAGLPDAGNVISLVGAKFGTSQNPSNTWGVNILAADRVAERFAEARIVALSSGNVYPLVPAGGAGSTESDPLTPVGEYPNAAVARERIFDFHSRRNGTSVAIIRLNYAVDLRYGVLLDVGRRVFAGEPVDVTMGYLNCIWQGDANDLILRSLSLAESPAVPLNLTGPKLSVRQIAEEFGRLLDKPVAITGSEADTALLNDASQLHRQLGEPPTPIDVVLRWTADWLRRGNETWQKPTRFEVRDGVF